MTSFVLLAAIHTAVVGAGPKGFTEAYQQSDASGRPLVILVGADWCAACQLMKNSVLPEVDRAGGLKGVVYAYVDAGLQQELAGKLLRGKALPQFVHCRKTSSGWKFQYLIGRRSAKQVSVFIAGSAPGRVARRPKPAAEQTAESKPMPQAAPQ